MNNQFFSLAALLVAVTIAAIFSAIDAMMDIFSALVAHNWEAAGVGFLALVFTLAIVVAVYEYAKVQVQSSYAGLPEDGRHQYQNHERRQQQRRLH